MERIACQWCGVQNDTSRTTCDACGAPIDVKNLVSDSGWAEAPRLRDMTEFRFSNSTCQIEGEIVPVAELALAQGDAVFFEHHTMLWKEPNVPVSALNTGGGLKRMLGGMPHIVTLAHGPGRIALSRDATGEVVVLPLHPSMEIDVREHAFLAGTHTLTYSFVRLGFANVLHGGGGMYMDRFITQQWPGLLLLHGYGNVFQKTLQPGEKIQVEPGGFLYKDSTVTWIIAILALLLLAQVVLPPAFIEPRLHLAQALGRERHVVDDAGAPVPDVAVRVRAEAAHGEDFVFDETSPLALSLTDVNGHFSIDHLADGNYAVLASARDGSERRIEPIAAGSHDVKLVLAAAGAIDGTLVGFTTPPVITGITE